MQGKAYYPALQTVPPHYDVYAGRRRAIQLARSGGLNTPCATEGGALRDFWKYVLFYKQSSTTGCWKNLPKVIQDAHAENAKVLAKAMVEAMYGGSGAGPKSGGSDSVTPIAAAKVGGACASGTGAMNDYFDKVINYLNSSGVGCWKFFPKVARDAHKDAMKTVIVAMLDYIYLPSTSFYRGGGGAEKSDSDERSGGVLPCVTISGAIKDYEEEVLGYDNFAGTYCFAPKLPQGVRTAFYEFASKTRETVNTFKTQLKRGGGAVERIDPAILAYARPPPRPCYIDHRFDHRAEKQPAAPPKPAAGNGVFAGFSSPFPFPGFSTDSRTGGKGKKPRKSKGGKRRKTYGGRSY